MKLIIIALAALSISAIAQMVITPQPHPVITPPLQWSATLDETQTVALVTKLAEKITLTGLDLSKLQNAQLFVRVQNIGGHLSAQLNVTAQQSP